MAYEYIDETPEIANYYAQEEDSETPTRSEPNGHGRGRSASSLTNATAAIAIPDTATTDHSTPSHTSYSRTSFDQLPSPTKRRRVDDVPNQYRVYTHGSPESSLSMLSQSPHLSHHSQPSPSTPAAHIGYASLLGTAQSPDPFEHYGTPSANLAQPIEFLSPRFWSQQPVWPHEDVQEACLMRYFVENLAHWVSTGDYKPRLTP